MNDKFFHVWSGCDATRWGNDNEHLVEESLALYLEARGAREPRMETYGFVPSLVCGYAGQSPDGSWVDTEGVCSGTPGTRYLLEYKAPWKCRARQLPPPGRAAAFELYKRETYEYLPSLGSHRLAWPPQYMAQVQFGANLGLLDQTYERILCVTWCPAGRARELPFLNLAPGASVAAHVAETRILHEEVVHTTDTHWVREAVVATPKGLITVSDIPKDTAWWERYEPKIRAWWERYARHACRLDKLRTTGEEEETKEEAP